MTNIGNSILQLRQSAGINRNALAVKAGVDPSYLMRLERGDIANPSFSVVEKIAAVLGVTTEYFAMRKKTPK